MHVRHRFAVPSKPKWLVAGLVALAAVGCGGAMGRRARQDDAWRPATVVEHASVVVSSPFDDDATRDCATFLAAHVEDVASLLEAPLDERLAIRLVPTRTLPADATPTEIFAAAERGDRGLNGYHVEGRASVVVYVPPAAGALGAAAMIAVASVVRHEAFHALAPRSRLGPRPHWLEEGLAALVMELEVDETGRPRWDVPTPERVLVARRLAGPGAVARLASWEPRTLADDDTAWDGELYPLAHALAWYLTRRSAGSFVERATAAAALTAKELAELEDEWLAWLASIDPVEEVARMAASQDLWLRARALRRLHQMACFDDEQRARLRSPAFVALAIDGLDAPETYRPAVLYLLFRVGSELDADTVERLATASQPPTVLLGQALRQRRGEPVDRPAVRAAEAELSAEWRAVTQFVSALLASE